MTSHRAAKRPRAPIGWTALLALALAVGAATGARAAPPAAVELTLVASHQNLRFNGGVVQIVATATNRSTAPVWTNASVCRGSWDVVVRDPNGGRVRIDYRDALRCPNDGLLDQSIAPGASRSLTWAWDGGVRQSPGKPQPAPGGRYTIEVSARWADHEQTEGEARPHTFVSKARMTFEVERTVAYVRSGNALETLFANFRPPKRIVVRSNGVEVAVPLQDYQRADDSRATWQGEMTAPDEIVVNGVRIPYYATYALETEFGRSGAVGLTGWDELQAAKYGVDVQALRNAIAADWTRQGKERDARRAAEKAAFEARFGVTLGAVDTELYRLRKAHEARVFEEMARQYGIKEPKLDSWGPGGTSLGIYGLIDGKPVLLYNGKLYRNGEKPRNYNTVCLPPETRIATPEGSVALGALRVGDRVLTRDRGGRTIAAPVLAKSVVPVRSPHSMVNVLLADGRRLRVSALHPSAVPGVVIGDWREGDGIDGSTVVERSVSAYESDSTQDILPAGDTGLYWANGVLVGSTLWRQPGAM